MLISFAPDTYKLSAVDAMKPAQSVREIRSFVGLVGYYQYFEDFALIAEPLRQLLHKRHRLELDLSTAEQAFQGLKE